MCENISQTTAELRDKILSHLEDITEDYDSRLESGEVCKHADPILGILLAKHVLVATEITSKLDEIHQKSKQHDARRN